MADAPLALSQVVTIAPVALVVGTLGPVESGVLDPAATKLVVVTTPVVWPLGGAVVKLTVDESSDGGASYRFSASNTLSGGVWHDKLGGVLASDTWTTTLMFAGANRKLRLSLDVLQACTVGATASVQ